MAVNQLFAKKSLKILLDEMAGEHRLRRVLGPVTLTSLGIGAVIGAGIFVATGAAARSTAGPALMMSYTVAGITCIFAALCYAEFASMAPVAGSAYTYAYTTMGELFAWIIGWDLVLEYAVGAATVANAWSGYFQSVLGKLSLVLPVALSGAPHKYDQGHILPNVYGELPRVQVSPDLLRYLPTRPLTVTQKVMQTKDRQTNDEKNTVWADGSQKPANGIYWIFMGKDAKGEEQPVVVGAVGDETTEAKIQNRERAVVNLPAI